MVPNPRHRTGVLQPFTRRVTTFLAGKNFLHHRTRQKVCWQTILYFIQEKIGQTLWFLRFQTCSPHRAIRNRIWYVKDGQWYCVVFERWVFLSKCVLVELLMLTIGVRVNSCVAKCQVIFCCYLNHTLDVCLYEMEAVVLLRYWKFQSSSILHHVFIW